jgi:YVTN family beta-propeller protein
MVISPNDELVLLAERRSQSIIEIDTATRSIAGTIVLDHRPQDIAASPDATTLYVTNADTDLRGGTLSQVDLRSGVASRLFRPASPAAVAATAGGTLLFVVNAWSEEVVVVDARLNRSVARIPVASPTSVAVDSHDELVFVGTIAGNVAVIDRAAMAVRDSIPLGGPVLALAVAPDGNRLYVATWVDSFTSSVAVIDTPTMASVATIPVAEPIADLLMAPDGETLYAATFKFYLNDITGGVVVLDLEAKEIVTTIVTGGVSDLAISPDGQTVYASTVFYDLFEHRPDQVSIIDAGTRSIRDSVEIDEIAAIAIDPTGDALYAASRGRPGEIAIIDTSSLEISAAVQSGLSPSDIAVIGGPEDRLCAGDCDADGAVTVAELIRGVNVLLSGARIDSCPAIDADSDQHVTVADLVSAVQQAIYGCSGGGK